MNSKQSNLQEYQHRLSTFGKRVLENLVKNLEERNECNKIKLRGRYTYGQNKCVLNFGDSSIITCPENVNESQNKTLDSDTSSCNFPDVTSPSIATSHGLLKAVGEDIVSDTADVCTQINRSTLSVVEECSIGRVPDNVVAVKDYIQWDNIFDTQLLNDLNILDTESNVQAQVDVTDECNAINPCKEYENDLCYSSKIIEELTKKSYAKDIESDCKNSVSYDHNLQPNISEKLGVNEGKTKRRSSNNITNVIPKKVKSALIDLPKHSMRKQKYTKAVKTWLNNAHHEHVMESDTCHETLAETLVLDEKKTPRKTVQAQLKNKGGVMKYGKPRNIELTSKNNISNDGITVKDKKGKSKFVAPVKSQIPSRNVSYSIINLNDDNVEGPATVLSTIIDKEITMILTFRNGFCQLDRNYPENTCEVEGAMFEIENVIYYWNNTYKIFCSTMGRIINQNTVVCYDGKNLLKYFASQCDMEANSTKVRMLDVQIGGTLVDRNNSMKTFSNVQQLLGLVPEYTITSPCGQQRRAWRLAMLGECFVKLKSMLVDYDLWKVFVEIEMQVLPVVADMERRGVRVDAERLQSMGDRLARRMAETERACHAAAGRTFQVGSAAQVRDILYEELRLDVRSDVDVKETLCKGDKSTSEGVLRGLMALHSLPRLILEYRHVHKAHATFLAGIAHQVKDGLVTPTWEQAAAATGRIACHNPNLQAIPKAPFSPVLFPAHTGEELSSEPDEPLNFRSVYIPREGHVLLAADFKHIECRVFAYAAADTGLLDALASRDLFRVLAAKWLNKSEESVSTEDRERTKRIVYASMYGAGTRKIMDILGASYDKTLSIMASFNRTFPSLKSFGRGVVARGARRGGRLATLCGRGGSFPHMCSDDSSLRSQAERQAVNFIIQGTAADLCKMAMVATTQRLREAEPPIRGHLLLQIHDELVWEVELPDLERAADEVKLAMEGIGESCGVALPLPVAVTAGRSWGSMQPHPAPRP